MAFLNYHHLRYFRTIVREGGLSRAAVKLNLSPPALSIQLKQLEESLGHELFERTGSGLQITEAGRLALDYAETICLAGEELQDLMGQRHHSGRKMLRIGAVATLSRNFQLTFIKPVLHDKNVEIVLRSGTLRELIVLLQTHQVDLILSNQQVKRDSDTHWHSHLLAEQPVSLVGKVDLWRRRKLQFPADMAEVSVILPSLDNETRASFDLILAAAGIHPRIAAEVDDMAMLRLLARETEGLTLVPPVVVQDEIRDGTLMEVFRIPETKEPFYAITPSRKFPNTLVAELVSAMGVHDEPRGKRKSRQA